MYDNTQKISVKPELKGFFTVYLLSAIPGIISSFLWMLLLVVIVFGAIAGLGATKNTSSPDSIPLNYTVTAGADKSSDSKILIYDLTGAISSGAGTAGVTDGIYLDKVTSDFKKIKDDKTIKNVVFRFNSPGGEVYASQMLGDQIRGLMESKGIATGVFYYDQIAASGALLATYKVPNYVIGNQYGETGSIGVRMSLPNFEKLADNIGYKETVIKAGDNKDIGNPLRATKPEELAYFQKMVDRTYDEFVNIVALGRKMDVPKVKTLANGFVFFNNDAVTNGLIDKVGTLDESVVKAALDVNVASYQTVKIESTKTLLQNLGVSTNLGNMLGLSNNAIDKINQGAGNKSGVMYGMDERY
jgi:protease IV